MNHLGHLFLSGNNRPLLYGNFIADGVKGRDYENYPPEIKLGILVHREIDSYTDTYAAFQNFKNNLYPISGKLTGVVIDLFIDHLLAKNWESYHHLSLEEYSKWSHQVIDSFAPHPEKVNLFLPHMKEHNWLLYYKKVEGFKWATISLGKRFKYPINLEDAVNFCIIEQSTFYPTFIRFVNDIQRHVQKFIINYHANSGQ